MLRYLGTVFLAYLCLVSGVPLESLETSLVPRETRDESFVVHGIDLLKLDKEGLERFSKAEDEVLVGELDLASGKAVKADAKRVAPLVIGAIRLAPYALRAGRLLYRTIRSRGALKISRRKITKNYFANGNFRSAYRHFNRITGGKYDRFQKGRVTGLKSRVGRHKVILRNRSGRGGRGPPTLEIQTPGYRPGVTKYRKIRFGKY